MTNLSKDFIKRRYSAIATNAVAAAMALQNRVIMTDDDAARRDAIYELLFVEATTPTPVDPTTTKVVADTQAPTNETLAKVVYSVERLGRVGEELGVINQDEDHA